MNIHVLYEDRDFLVLNKPAGLMVHGDGRSLEPTLVDWLLSHYHDIKGIGEPIIVEGSKPARAARPDELRFGRGTDGLKVKSVIERPGIVHRLDKGTSGAMVVAKNQQAFEFLKKQFQARTVEKVYHAIVWGNIKKDSGVIDKPIGRSKKDFRRWSSLKDAGGEMREALTEFKVLGRAGDFTFIEARPKTGRTHQIRVHMKAVNHPLVGDELYAPGRESVLGLARTALHAYSIKFVGMDGKKIFVTAPYPEDFRSAMEKI